MMESRHAQRKNEHLSLAAKYYDQVHQHHYFDQVLEKIDMILI